MNFLISSVLLFYAILKDLIWTQITIERIDACWTYRLLIYIVFLTLAVVTLISFMICMLPFILFKLCIRYHLKKTYGPQYGGMLDGHSAIYEAYEHKKVGIVTVMIVLIRGTYSDFYQHLKTVIDKMCTDNKKLSSKVAVFGGYQFYLNQDYTSNDILSDITFPGLKTITRNRLIDFLESYQITSDPLWEVIVFKQPIAWNFKLAHETFAILLRINHCVVDGYHLIGLLRKYMFDFKLHRHCCRSWKRANNCISLDRTYILDNPVNFLSSTNVILKTWPNQFITIFTEGCMKYVSIIKSIKRKLDVTFSIVLLAGIYAAIDDFMQQRRGWDKIDIFCNLRANAKETEQMIKGTYRSDELKNCYTIISVKLGLKKIYANPAVFVDYVNQEYRYSRDSMSEHTTEFLAHCVYNYLPTALIKKPFEYDCYTRNIVQFSNILELREEAIFGSPVIDVFSFMPLLCSKGMMFSVMTYNGRLKLTLAAREGVISCREELRTIIRNMLQFIDELAEDLMIEEEPEQIITKYEY